MNRILFIGHEADRTGAPIVLLHYLQWLKKNKPHYEIDLMLLRSGDLEEEYRKVANVYLLAKNETPSIFQRLTSRLKAKVEIKTEPLQSFSSTAPFDRNYDVVLGNTIVSLEYLEFFKRRGFPTICWLHELEYIVKSFSEQKFIELSDCADQYIIVSKAVEDMLKQFGIKKKTSLVYEFSKTELKADENVETIKNELGIPPNAFVVGGCGTIEWRKGVDLFMHIARRIIAKNQDVYFVWVGGKSPHSDLEYNQVQHDFERLNLENRLVFTGVQKNPLRIFAAMDLFALTSREDPFPLVCLEAASLGKPIICFEDAGGMPEFVEEDAGATVAYGDVNAFCEKIIYFYTHREELFRAGQTARKKIDSSFSAEKSCRKIDEVLAEFLD
jgi:glycosyltransferase involved in cell wall biosynthesis